MLATTTLCTFLLFLNGSGEPAERIRWETGTALAQRLAAPVSLGWTNVPATRALHELAAAEHVAIVLDRRIDPDRELRLTVDEQPLGEVLSRIAEQLHAEYRQFGPVAYLGPPAAAARLNTLAALRLDDVKKLPAARARKLLRLGELDWNDLAEPRQLVTSLAREAEVRVIGEELIPHDLWPAAQLPSLSWIDRLTLVVGEFDLTFRVNAAGDEITLVTAPERAAVERTYRAPRDAAAVAKRLSQELPDAQVKLDGARLRVRGTVEDQQAVARALGEAPQQRTTVTAGQKQYQLAIESAALDKVVAQLAGRLALEVAWDRAAIDQAGISVDQLISVKVKDASLDELLTAVFQGTGLKYERRESAVRISPRAR